MIPDYEHAHSLASEERDNIMESLRQLVGQLDQDALLELRSLQRPSLEVEELLAAVIMVVKSPSADLSWTKGAKRLMANLDR